MPRVAGTYNLKGRNCRGFRIVAQGRGDCMVPELTAYRATVMGGNHRARFPDSSILRNVPMFLMSAVIRLCAIARTQK